MIMHALRIVNNLENSCRKQISFYIFLKKFHCLSVYYSTSSLASASIFVVIIFILSFKQLTFNVFHSISKVVLQGSFHYSDNRSFHPILVLFFIFPSFILSSISYSVKMSPRDIYRSVLISLLILLDTTAFKEMFNPSTLL